MSTGYEIKARIHEIASDLEEGKPKHEITNEYVEKWGVSERTMKRYLAFANDILAKQMSRRDVLLDAIRAESIDECMEASMRSTLELEARLCAIAQGEMELDRKIHTKNGVVDVKQKPSYTNMLYAIDRILRMRGCYSPQVRKLDEPRPVMKFVYHRKVDREIVEKMMEQSNSRLTEEC